MKSADDFPWPKPPGFKTRPKWNGRAFTLQGRKFPVLAFGSNKFSWDEGLQNLHDATAGEDHAINRASREYALYALKKYIAPKARVILEVGSSSGFMLRQIRRAFSGPLVIGSDCFPEAFTGLVSHNLGIPLLQFDINRCPLKEACVDAVVLLNVLEHVRNDAKALAEVYRVLRPGGIAVIEVPASPWLYDVYDEWLKHFRRYRLGDLLKKSRRAGFEVARASHLGVLIFPAFALVKLVNKWAGGGRVKDKAGRVALNNAATRNPFLIGLLLACERYLHHWMRFPFGIRCTCVLRKP